MLRVGLTGGLGSGKSTAAAMLAAHGAHVLSSDTIGRELMQPGQPVHAAIVHHFGPEILLPTGTREHPPNAAAPGECSTEATSPPGTQQPSSHSSASSETSHPQHSVAESNNQSLPSPPMLSTSEIDRAALSKLAFSGGRIEELNAIVHPAVIARQEELLAAIAARDPHAVAIVESALIFETKHSGRTEGWRTRFDALILVAASEDTRIARFLQRSALNPAELTPEARAHLEAEAHRRLSHQIPDDRKSSCCDYVLTNDTSLEELQWQVDHLWPLLQQRATST